MSRWLAIAVAIGLAHAATAFVLFKNDDGQPLRWRLDDLDPLVHPNVVNRDTRATGANCDSHKWRPRTR